MKYNMLDQGFCITLTRSDGESVCFQGDDANTFRSGLEDCPSFWTLANYIDTVGYDDLFNKG